MSANEKQIAGDHYKTPGGVEHWDIVVMHELNYFEGQITKYVMRARKKNGLQDLQKAHHFLEKYMEVYNEAFAPKVPDSEPRYSQEELARKLRMETSVTFEPSGFRDDDQALIELEARNRGIVPEGWTTTSTEYKCVKCGASGFVSIGITPGHEQCPGKITASL